MSSLQVSLRTFWTFMTLLCIKATWSECRDSCPRCMTTGEKDPQTFGFVFNMLLQIKCYFILRSLYLCSFHVLGSAGVSLQQDFYTIERLSEEIAGSAFSSLDHVPDHRLRPMIHILALVLFQNPILSLLFILLELR